MLGMHPCRMRNQLEFPSVGPVVPGDIHITLDQVGVSAGDRNVDISWDDAQRRAAALSGKLTFLVARS
jgi:hypothetical protein